MNKRIKKYIYYFIIIVLFLLVDRIIILFKIDNKNSIINDILVYENSDLKNEVEELSNINYDDYNYVLGKITVNHLYNNNAIFIKTNDILDNYPVINDIGLIGIIHNNYLEPINNLNISIKINNNIGMLEKGIIKITKGDYKINDKIYTSGLTNIPGNILVGTIKSIVNYDLYDEININFIDIKNTYVGILTYD